MTDASEAEPTGRTDALVCAPVRIVAPGPTSSQRAGALLIAALIGLAILKPWGIAEAPPAEPQPVQPVVAASRPPEAHIDPVEAVCHSSSSWRVASVGQFMGFALREWAFVTPVPAAGPEDPTIPFAVFGFSKVDSLGYCAPSATSSPLDLDVRVFRLGATGSGTAVTVARETLTPVTSVAGLFSIIPSGPRSPQATAGSGPDTSWPAGRYVFALLGDGYGDVWFGAEVRSSREIN